MIEYTTRPVVATDEAFLWEMLYYAAHMHEEVDKTVADLQRNPTLALYVQEWGRRGDFGFIAEATTTNIPLGAAWLRLYTGDNKAYSPTTDDTPELAIAILPQYTGKGIGTALLQELLTVARLHFPAVALSVRADNPASVLYQRLGFQIIGEITNRVGGISYDMRYPCNQSGEKV